MATVAAMAVSSHGSGAFLARSPAAPLEALAAATAAEDLTGAAVGLAVAAAPLVANAFADSTEHEPSCRESIDHSRLKDKLRTAT